MEHEPTSFGQKKKEAFSTNQEFPAAPEVPLKRKAKKKSKARKNKQKGNATVVAVTEPQTVFNAVMQELLDSFMDMPEVFEEPLRNLAIDIPIAATPKSPVIVRVTSEQRIPSFIPLQRDEESSEKKEKEKEKGKEKEKEKHKEKKEPPKEEERLPTWIAVDKTPVKEQKSTEIQGHFPKPGELSLAPQLTPPEETLEKPKSEEASKQELPQEDTLKGKEHAKREEPERRKKRRGHPPNWERTIGTEIPPKLSVV